MTRQHKELGVLSTSNIAGYDDVQRYYWRKVYSKCPNELDKLKSLTSNEPEIAQPTVPYELHRVGRLARQAAAATQSGIQIGVSAHNMPGSGMHYDSATAEKLDVSSLAETRVGEVTH